MTSKTKILSRSIIAVLLPTLILIGSCDTLPTKSGGAGGTDSKVDFPSGIGMLWKYRVYDSLTQTTDTVWISITDTLTIRSNEFFAKSSEKHFADMKFGAQYFRTFGDTLEIFSDTMSLTADERIVFPLDLGSGWSGPFRYDTSTVAMIGEIEVSAGVFDSSARIDRYRAVGFEGSGYRSSTWVAPGVGIVFRSISIGYGDGGGGEYYVKNEVWELLDYDLTTFALSEFPNQVGSFWTYASLDSFAVRRDSALVVFDTVTVTIVSAGVLGSGEAYTIWEFAGKELIDSQFVLQGQERLSFQRDSVFYPIWNMYYEFPLAVGKNWGIEFFAPVPEVLDKEAIATAAGSFESSFHIQMSGGAFNDYWYQDDWLAPGVGIVKTSRRQFGFIPWVNRTRTLIDYHIVD